MTKLDDVKREYSKAYDRIVKLAEPIAAWRAELAACEVEAPQLADQRIAALTCDDAPAADKLHDQIRQKQSRAADLRGMIAKREGEKIAALEQLARVESVAVARAAYEDAQAEKIAARDEIAKLAPQWNRLQHRLSVAAQNEATLTTVESEALNIQNQRRWVEQHAALLNGEAVDDLYMPSWLNGHKGV